MSFDISRCSFDPQNHFLGVIMQQGRVQLDADWNDWVDQLLRRLQAGTVDTVGRAVVPRETPEGFHITLADGTFIIGTGRGYFDGLLAENHGAAPENWERTLAELTGTVGVAYDEQPYYPDPPPLPPGGPHLVYVDVWKREVTHLQYPDLVEKAVGVDTTGRLQTVWQVKVLANVGNVICATPDEEIPGWPEATQASAARLTTTTGEVEGEPDPCLLPPSGGYRGLENQLYRVEVHQGGPIGVAAFTWSRDNATVATAVTEINEARDRLRVESIRRDQVLRFSAGDWVEVKDDWLELHGLSGELRRIGSVDETARTITLEEALTEGLFPTDAQGNTDPDRLTQLRRWDQKGQVRRSDGTVFHDLDDAGSTGAIPVPPPGTELLLERGILVRFDLEPAGGEFKTGDYWVFAARTADASIEMLVRAPPRGIHHHYARLALVSFVPDAVTDCRVLWPPEAHEGCDCSVCVTAEAHNGGTATLQHAVDQVKETGGTVCLGPGVYRLRAPLRINGAKSFRLRGQGWGTMIVGSRPGPVIEIDASTGVALENLTAVGSSADTAGGTGVVALHNVVCCDLQRVYLLGLATGEGVSAAMTLSGYVFGQVVHKCTLAGGVGVASITGQESRILLTAGLDISDNLFSCDRRGVSLGRQSLHYGKTCIGDNFIVGCRQVAIEAVGGVLPGYSLRVDGNTLQVSGDGIAIGTDGARIRDNDIVGARGGDGIALVPGIDPGGMDHCQVIGNRILNMQGHGIAIQTPVKSAMIKQNVIDGVGRGAIVMEGAGSAGHLVVENNQLLNIARGFNAGGQTIAAIQIIETSRAEVLNNVLDRFAREAVQSQARVGLQAVGIDELRMAGNLFQGVGPIGQFVGDSVAVELLAPFVRGGVSDNTLIRQGSDEEASAEGRWWALRIGPPPSERPFFLADDLLSVAIGDTAAVFTANRLRVVTVQRGSGSVSVRGNHLESRAGRTPLAEIDGVETGLFTENRCVQTTVATAGAVTPLVILRNGNFVASNNRLRGSGDRDTLHVFSSRFAIVGNLINGLIKVDGEALADPWRLLNVMTED